MALKTSFASARRALQRAGASLHALPARPCMATTARCRRASAACAAQRRPLFLERYLDEPIELAVARRSGRPVPREEIVEVGNLAAFGSASARLLIVALTDLLVAQGFRWVVFTGTPALLNSFQRLALEPLALARPTRRAWARSWPTGAATMPAARS